MVTIYPKFRGCPPAPKSHACENVRFRHILAPASVREAISEGGWTRCRQAIRQVPPKCRLGGSQGCDWYGPEGSCNGRRGALWRPPTHHPPAHLQLLAPLLVFPLSPPFTHDYMGAFGLLFGGFCQQANAGALAQSNPRYPVPVIRPQWGPGPRVQTICKQHKSASFYLTISDIQVHSSGGTS